MTTRQVTFKVPTDVDTFQDNYIGLIIHEINKARVTMQGSISSAYSDILTSVRSEMAADLASAETAINAKIAAEIANVEGGAIAPILDEEGDEVSNGEGTVITQVKNYVDDQLALFEKHVTESLSTKANDTTTVALDEFFKVVDSAMTFAPTEGENTSYQSAY